MSTAALVDRQRQGASAALNTGSTSVLALVVVWLMVIASVLAWRFYVFYSGGVDPVVAAKSALSATAFLLALALWVRSPTRLGLKLGARTVTIVSVYVVVTVLGGAAAGVLLPAATLAVRVGLLVATIALVVMCAPAATVLRSLCIALVVAGVVCSFSKLGVALGGARLTGGLLPLSPNQLSMMFGAALLVLIWRAVVGGSSPLLFGTGAGLVGLLWLTGSRTGLVAVISAIIVVVVLAQRLPLGVVVGVLASLPVGIYLTLGTDLVSSFFERGGFTSITTLNSRTIAWEAAIHGNNDFWQQYFGRGLTAKTVDVRGTYWDSQVVDSSWVSAFLQGGLVCMVLLAVWTVLTVWSAFRIARPGKALWTGLSVFCLVWSLTASGMVDAHLLFVLMALASLATERPMRSWAAMERPATDLDVISTAEPVQVDVPVLVDTRFRA